MASKFFLKDGKYRWEPFSGFSILFDPGAPHYQGNMLALRTQESAFYSELHSTFSKLLKQNTLLGDPLRFMPVEPSSWHVTIWDGINSGNFEALPHDQKNIFADFLLSLDWQRIRSDIRRLIEKELRWLIAMGPINFKFRKLYKHRDQVLVVSLMPADLPSLDKLHKYKLVRQNLNIFFEDTFGFAPCGRYLPHNTLGYFTDIRHGRAFSTSIDEANELLKKSLSNKLLSFQHAAIFTFDNMNHFYKI